MRRLLWTPFYLLAVQGFRIQSRSRPLVSLSESLKCSSVDIQLDQLEEVDLVYNRRSSLTYDPVLERYVKIKEQHHTSLSQFFTKIVAPRLSVAFLPSGVTSNYYTFMRWRILQRFASANLFVFGTQSLLMGLGFKNTIALSAAIKWVLKDALGKMVRMIWAAKMGRRFDSDAKRWRFRSALVFALGNGLEIITYIFPSMFLLWATLANCCKQISMLTSSSTRTAIYNSFRDGTRENIGDITAKGEAQIAFVDLFGIVSGVSLSRTVGTSVQAVLTVYFVLQALDIVCMHRQLSCVQYRVLNFERLVAALEQYCSSADVETPKGMAASERIFLPPHPKARRGVAFGSLSRAKLTPTELQQLLALFAKERFLLVVNVNQHQDCHVVLHEEATNVDIVKATLALTILRRKESPNLQMVKESLVECNQLFGPFLRKLAERGWESPARSMFGRPHMRAYWPRG
jgi:hypothetical protein